MKADEIKSEALRIIEQFENLPRLVVFDLDYTLWPFYCDCCYEDYVPNLFPQARGILCALEEKGIDMAIASRTETPDLAATFLETLGIKSLFVAQEMYPTWMTHKTEHFARIHRTTGVPFNSMLFFDDENRNIQAVSKVGVTSILVGNGVDLSELSRGLCEYSRGTSSAR